jgi:hypothetical protein
MKQNQRIEMALAILREIEEAVVTDSMREAQENYRATNDDNFTNACRSRVDNVVRIYCASAVIAISTK